MSTNHFDVVILIGRPAAGKSEVIDYLRKTPLDERLRRFHIGQFEEFDDFVYVWETFEVDDILSRHGKPRLWSDEKYWFKDPFAWDLYIERLNLAYRKKLAGQPQYHDGMTSIVEFSRGGENGFGEAFWYLHEEILLIPKTGYQSLNHSFSAGLQLQEKQKAKYTYGILERQFRNIFNIFYIRRCFQNFIFNIQYILLCCSIYKISSYINFIFYHLIMFGKTFKFRCF